MAAAAAAAGDDTNEDDDEKSDVFPCNITEGDVPHISKRPDFKRLVQNKRLFAFIVCSKDHKISYKPLAFKQKHAKHFVDIGTKLSRTLNSTSYTNWYATEKRLKHSVTNAEAKHNIDRRTCYKFDQHVFLAKAPFTTGQRLVAPGTEHIYQMHKADMKFYFPNPQYKRRVRFIKKRFREQDQHFYSVRTLKAFHNYIIPENTVYILLAVQDCFFSIHIVKTNSPLSLVCINPLTELNAAATAAAAAKNSASNVYAFPMPTPQIENINIKQSDDEEDEAVEATADISQPICQSMPSLQKEIETHPSEIVCHQIVIVKDKNINIVAPDRVKWYQEMNLKWHNHPKANIVFGSSNQTEALNLSTHPAVSNPSTPSAAPMVNDTLQMPPPPPSVMDPPSVSICTDENNQSFVPAGNQLMTHHTLPPPPMDLPNVSESTDENNQSFVPAGNQLMTHHTLPPPPMDLPNVSVSTDENNQSFSAQPMAYHTMPPPTVMDQPNVSVPGFVHTNQSLVQGQPMAYHTLPSRPPSVIPVPASRSFVQDTNQVQDQPYHASQVPLSPCAMNPSIPVSNFTGTNENNQASVTAAFPSMDSSYHNLQVPSPCFMNLPVPNTPISSFAFKAPATPGSSSGTPMMVANETCNYDFNSANPFNISNSTDSTYYNNTISDAYMNVWSPATYKQSMIDFYNENVAMFNT